MGNRDLVAELDTFVSNCADGKNITVVEGGSGSGKSALIANFQKQHSDRNSDDFMISHYVGCSSDSTDLGETLRRLIVLLDGKDEEESLKKLPESSEIPQLARMFNESLKARATKVGKNKKAKMYVILDGLSQFDELTYFDELRAEHLSVYDLQWLPPNRTVCCKSIKNHEN